MPKQNQSETLSLPQLLQLAGIGGQPQQDSTREALSYMMGQQRLASEDADRKVKQLQNEQENAYRLKALDAQVNQKDNTAALHALALLFANSTDPMQRASLSAHIRSLTGMPEEVGNKVDLLANHRTNFAAWKNKNPTADPVIGLNLLGIPDEYRAKVVADYAPPPPAAVPASLGLRARAGVGKLLSGDTVANAFYAPAAHLAEFVTGNQYDHRSLKDQSTAMHVAAEQEKTAKYLQDKAIRHNELMNFIGPTIPAGYSPPLLNVPFMQTPEYQSLNLGDQWKMQETVDNAQAQTQEYLKRKAALRQAAGLQP